MSHDHSIPVSITPFNIHTHLFPTQYPQKWLTYVQLPLHAYCTLIQHLLNSIFLHSLYLTVKPAREKSILHVKLQYMYYPTCAYISIFLPKVLKKKSAWMITRISQYRPFIMKYLSYIHKTSPRHIKKIDFAKIILIWLITFSTSLSTCILTSSYRILSRGQEVGRLHYVRTLVESPAWSDSLPPTLGWTWRHTATIQFFIWNYRSYFHAKPPACL